MLVSVNDLWCFSGRCGCSRVHGHCCDIRVIMELIGNLVSDSEARELKRALGEREEGK